LRHNTPVEETREERVARNEAVFREANERLRWRVVHSFPGEGTIPFICECGNERCTAAVRVSIEVYEQARLDPVRFLIAPGHKQLSSEEIVDQGEGFEIVEKRGRAAEILSQLPSPPSRRRAS
jgi:hypothetical protein